MAHGKTRFLPLKRAASDQKPLAASASADLSPVCTNREKRGFPRALLQSPQKLSNLLSLGEKNEVFPG